MRKNQSREPVRVAYDINGTRHQSSPEVMLVTKTKKGQYIMHGGRRRRVEKDQEGNLVLVVKMKVRPCVKCG
jgi:hypothetical protein